MKSMGAPAGVNRTVTLVGSFVLSFAILIVIAFGTISVYHRGWLDRGWEIDAMPLTIDDLLDAAPDGYDGLVLRSEESLLLGQLSFYQHPRHDAPNYRELPSLQYTVTLVKAPFLYDLCRERLLHALDYQNRGDPEEPRYYYQSVDPAPWGAREAYRWTRTGLDSPRNIYLLFYADRMVEIELDPDWEVTPAQMAVVGEKLGG